jgi:LmbE family N-acetylglucosaminyl deacetylase
MFIIAHPDDESYLFSGTLLLNHKAGGQNYIICATSGEKGKSHLKKEISPKQLASIRKKELIAVSKYLKVKKLFFLNIPDSMVMAHKDLLSKKISKIISDYKPDYLLGFGLDGVSGHLDHITTGLVTKTLAKKMKIPHISFQGSPLLLKRSKLMKQRRKEGSYSNNFSYQKPNIIIKIDPKVKLKALHFHKSQLDKSSPFLNIPKKIATEIMSHEYFLSLN